MSAPIRLFVGNLPDKVNENELRKAFSIFGEITALDIKSKPAVDNDKKLFAFLTLSASNYNIESCIQHFTNGDFNGNRLYVTRARESFLERLQREREQAQRKEVEKIENLHTNVTPKPLKINHHSHKRKFETNDNTLKENGYEKKIKKKFEKDYHKDILESKIRENLVDSLKSYSGDEVKNFDKDDKQKNADKKRLESMKKKSQEFNQKKMIIKTGLTNIDKSVNKKVIFPDDDNYDKTAHENGLTVNNIDNNKRKNLFDEEDNSDNEVNFDIKEQFEGKKGQKVLDLQSRYKADKRFVLDERFIEDDKSDEENNQHDKDESVDLGQADEKYKQLNILQDVLGVPIKMKQMQHTTKQNKSKLGMLRFDPTHPEHAKFLAPVATKQELNKVNKKQTKETPKDELIEDEPKKIEKVEVSKEQFYKVTDTLKEALEQPKTFSLRSLFGKDYDNDANEERPEEVYEHNIPLVTKAKKVKHPLDPGEKNPFLYDSSDSENEDNTNIQLQADSNINIAPQLSTSKPVWRESLFFLESDERLTDGLLFFTQSSDSLAQKYRRELKSVMKKRVYNKERKNQMFQKKIGGRRKIAAKSFRKKS